MVLCATFLCDWKDMCEHLYHQSTAIFFSSCYIVRKVCLDNAKNVFGIFMQEFWPKGCKHKTINKEDAFVTRRQR